MPNDIKKHEGVGHREVYDLEVQSISDHPQDGVLATIGGKFSTSAEPSRNDRTYTPDLWRSVISSERVKEMLETKTFYGELSHPPRAAEFLSEVQMNNISHNIIKLEFDEKTQDLIGSIDILDTPSGRIASTLLKYGSKIGISSRGIVMDDAKFNSNSNEMNPDNYYLVTFDLVALPGIMGARLDHVATESMTPQNKTRLILESLQELKHTLNSAKDNNDKESVKVLEAIAKGIKSDKEMKSDPQIQKAIKDLTKRDESPTEAEKTLGVDDDTVDKDKITAAVLEKEKNEEDEDELEDIEDTDTEVKVKPSQEDASDGITQSSDIQGGMKSSVNMIGDPLEQDDKKIKKFLEAFENINTVEDVAKYVESLEGVEAKDGKVIINKDTVLFNTMLSMINSMRLHSDANPLVKPGTSITNVKNLDKEYFGTEPENSEYDQDDKKPEVIKKSIKGKENPHNASLESALGIIKSSNNKIEELQNELLSSKSEALKSYHEAELLKSRLKSNYLSYTESLEKKDKTIKELSAKINDADKTKKRAATEAVNNLNSYKALESVNLQLKTNLQSVQEQHKALKDKYEVLSGRVIENRKDSRIRKLMEAQSFMVERIDEDEYIRTANENYSLETTPIGQTEEQLMTKLLSKKFVTKK